MEKDEIQKACDDALKLYLANNTDALIKIRDNKNETLERRMAADFVIHIPKDPRRM